MLHTLWELMKSPKIIPFVLLAIVLLLLMMIEPFRLISVAQTLTLNWREEDSRMPMDNAREEELRRLNDMFRKRPSGIIVISGSEGVGKSTLLRKLLDHRRLAVRIDYAGKSSALTEEGQLIENLENAIGFSPSFNSINQALSVIESFLPMKQQGLGMTKQWQLTKIFKTLDSALKWISMSFPVDHQTPFDYPVIVFDGFHELIDGDKSKNLLENLVRWSLNTSQMNQTAHVVFISDNIFAEERLKSFSPLRGRINSVYINDLTAEEATKFVSEGLQRKIVGVGNDNERLSPFSIPGIISLVKQGLRGWRQRSNTATKVTETVNVPAEELAKVPAAVGVLGGRLSDLESLVVRFRAGKGIEQSMAEMIDDARKDILIKGFGGKFASASTGKKWSKTQLWRSMKQVSVAPAREVDYITLLDVVFEGDEEPLHAMVKENLLGITVRKLPDGRETKVVNAHSPLLLASFRELVRDDTIRKRMEKLVTDEKVDKVKKDVRDIEEELTRLAKSKALSKNDSVSQRETFLHGKLQALNDKLRTIEEDYAKELASQVAKK